MNKVELRPTPILEPFGSTEKEKQEFIKESMEFIMSETIYIGTANEGIQMFRNKKLAKDYIDSL